MCRRCVGDVSEMCRSFGDFLPENMRSALVKTKRLRASGDIKGHGSRRRLDSEIVKRGSLNVLTLHGLKRCPRISKPSTLKIWILCKHLPNPSKDIS